VYKKGFGQIASDQRNKDLEGAPLEGGFSMSDASNANWFTRVFSNDACRKGLAGALAGLLVAAISETLWGSSQG
jgi:hypothetical protein